MTLAYFGGAIGVVGAIDSFVGATDSFVGVTDSFVGATDSFVGVTDSFVGATDSFVETTDSFVDIVVADGWMVVFDGNGGGSIAKEIKLYFPSNILVLSCFDKRLLFASLLAFEANITLTSVVFCTKEK